MFGEIFKKFSIDILGISCYNETYLKQINFWGKNYGKDDSKW